MSLIDSLTLSEPLVSWQQHRRICRRTFLVCLMNTIIEDWLQARRHVTMYCIVLYCIIHSCPGVDTSPSITSKPECPDFSRSSPYSSMSLHDQVICSLACVVRTRLSRPKPSSTLLSRGSSPVADGSPLERSGRNSEVGSFWCPFSGPSCGSG